MCYEGKSSVGRRSTMRTAELTSAASAWRGSLNALLNVAEQVGPMDDFLGDLSVEGATDEETLDAAVDAATVDAIAKSEHVADLLSPDLDTDSGTRGQLLAALIGNLETAD